MTSLFTTRFRSTKPPPHKATMAAVREEHTKKKEIEELFHSFLLHIYLLVVLLMAANSSLPDMGHWTVYGINTAMTGK